MIKISKMSKILSIALVCAMLFGSGSTLGSFVTSFSGTHPPAPETNITIPDGGGSGVANISMPTIGVAVGSMLTVNGAATNQTHFTDYRAQKAPGMNYNTNYYHAFPPVDSQYNPAEMSVSKNGATLRKC